MVGIRHWMELGRELHHVKLHNEVKCQCIFTSVRPHFQFTKNIHDWNLENVYLVICGSLLVVEAGTQFSVMKKQFFFLLLVPLRLWFYEQQ